MTVRKTKTPVVCTLTAAAAVSLLGIIHLPLVCNAQEDTNDTDTVSRPAGKVQDQAPGENPAETKNALGAAEEDSSTTATINAPDSEAATENGTGASSTETATAKRMKPVTLKLPPQLAEIVRLAMSGSSDDDILARIREQNRDYTVTREQIEYLRDLGISDRVVNALTSTSGAAVASTDPSRRTKAEDEYRHDDDRDRDRDRDTNRVPSDVTGPAYPVYAAPPVYPQYNSSYAYGYANFSMFDGALSPYGNWYDLPGHGLCWQPLVGAMNRNWMPYGNNGQWISTDAGWYWKSGYSWGWAPFHYGRWFKSNPYGWVWQPDRQWGPAWVSWRKAPDYVGWAPLPPGATFSSANKNWLYYGRPVGPRYDFGLLASAYMFVPFAQFTQKFRNSPYAPATLVKPQVFDQSMVYNDLIVGPNQMIINRGVEPRLIQIATGTPVVPVPVRDVVEHRRHGQDRNGQLSPTGWSSGHRHGGADQEPGSGQPTPGTGNPQNPPQPGTGGTPTLPPAPTLPPQPGSTPYGGGKSIPQRGPMSGYREASDQPNWIPGPGGYVSPRGWTPPGFDPQAGRGQASPATAGAAARGVPIVPGRGPAGVPAARGGLPGTAAMAPAAPAAPSAGAGAAPAGR